ncbi:hypothetical protein QR680_015278 [Steinernema hermaphroditum]|uniref:Amino acid transporter transmembrane domain-containing protein n=1 Tax=Steinernema hermaphroditum TaxID=289476 RepID=A0AA39H753_9BILA|nr:hypothetical protein QR680_015278 [Steinernema hermaphroditum]
MLPKFLLFTAFCSLLLIYTTHGAPTDKRLSPGEDLKSAGPLLLQEDCNTAYKPACSNEQPHQSPMSSKLLLFTALYALLFVSLALGSPAQQFLSLEKDARKVFAPRFAGRYCNNGTGITCPVFCGILLCHGCKFPSERSKLTAILFSGLLSTVVMTPLSLLVFLTVLLIPPQAVTGRLTIGFQFLHARKHNKHLMKHMHLPATTVRPFKRDYSFLLKQPILFFGI